MTDTTTDRTEPTDDTIDEGTDDTITDETTTEEETPNTEAAKYRRRLRETEAERDALAANLDATRRQVVERLVVDHTGPRLGDPKDLWLAGVELAELVDAETGAVDPDKVAAAQARVLADHPTWRVHQLGDIGQGVRAGRPGQPGLSEVLRDRARGRAG
ncbi:MAG TPA: hypothetical protein VM388_10540 [Acidimicrobiales bacterium]|nr:hypothetical protein [Acidimicrobiales bacterium]